MTKCRLATGLRVTGRRQPSLVSSRSEQNLQSSTPAPATRTSANRHENQRADVLMWSFHFSLGNSPSPRGDGVPLPAGGSPKSTRRPFGRISERVRDTAVKLGRRQARGGARGIPGERKYETSTLSLTEQTVETYAKAMVTITTSRMGRPTIPEVR